MKIILFILPSLKSGCEGQMRSCYGACPEKYALSSKFVIVCVDIWYAGRDLVQWRVILSVFHLSDYHRRNLEQQLFLLRLQRSFIQFLYMKNWDGNSFPLPGWIWWYQLRIFLLRKAWQHHKKVFRCFPILFKFYFCCSFSFFLFVCFCFCFENGLFLLNLGPQYCSVVEFFSQKLDLQ